MWELATNAGRIVSHDDLFDRVWGPGSPRRLTNLRAAIKNLRRRLGDDARFPSYIFTVPKAGYQMRRDGDE